MRTPEVTTDVNFGSVTVDMGGGFTVECSTEGSFYLRYRTVDVFGCWLPEVYGDSLTLEPVTVDQYDPANAYTRTDGQMTIETQYAIGDLVDLTPAIDKIDLALTLATLYNRTKWQEAVAAEATELGFIDWQNKMAERAGVVKS